MRMSAKILGVVLLLLLAATSLIWYAALREDHRGRLVVSFLDVGQGDAIFLFKRRRVGKFSLMVAPTTPSCGSSGASCLFTIAR